MKLRHVLSIAALASVSSTAVAGLVLPTPVLLNLDARTAQGGMATARFSTNPFEFIGCGVRYRLLPDGSLTSFGFCQAGIAEDVFFACFSFDTALVDQMAKGNDYSFIQFTWNEDAECTSVRFSTQSFHIPEHLDKKPK